MFDYVNINLRQSVDQCAVKHGQVSFLNLNSFLVRMVQVSSDKTTATLKASVTVKCLVRIVFFNFTREYLQY